MTELKSLIDIIKDESIILIPAMQRDYVQGRMHDDKEENVIKNFISYLKEALLNKTQCELDFIYGVKKDNKYIILDGQQRITTLFLLYWYLAQKSNKMKKFREKFTLKENGILKSKLQYEVRASSLDFCNTIVGENLYNDFNNGEKISDIIKNKNWFMYLWYYDPTINAMLNTMDVINSQFKDCKDIDSIFNNLIEKKLISFQFLDLEDKSMSLSDDIYIKMNSTGIPLTAFENFKAKLEQYLNKENIEPQLQYKIDDKCFNLREYFSRKIDTEWSDFFLSYCKNNKNKFNENKFDEKVMNFFHNIFYNEYYEKIYLKENKEKKESKEDYFNNVLYFEDYYCSKVINEESIKGLIVFLDCLVKMKECFDKYNKYKRYDISKNLDKILNNNATFMDRINFAALYKYIIKYSDKILDDNTIDNFNEFIRIIVNYTENTDYSKDNYIRDIKAIDEFIRNSDNILDFVKNTDIKCFDVYQREEEKIKASLITENEELWKNRIIEIENNEFFKYQIKFLLDMCVKSVNDIKEYDVELFDKYRKIAEYIFNSESGNECINKDIEEERLFERALLTYKEECYLFLEWENNFYNKSKEYWKEMLKKDDFIPILKYVFDEIYKYYNGDNLDNIKDSLSQIIDNSEVKDWRKLLINDYYEYLNYFKRILHNEEVDDKLYLIEKNRMNSRHVEFFSFLLYLFLQNKNLNSNIEMEYIKQIRSDEEPYLEIYIDNKTIKVYGEQLSSKNRYKMEVYKKNNLICTKHFKKDIKIYNVFYSNNINNLC